jgi:Domain of unknown function (DUF5666)
MDPNDPTQSAAPLPPPGQPGDWPPPALSQTGPPTLASPGVDAPQTAAYPAALPAAPSYFPHAGHADEAGSGAGGPRRSAPGLLVAGAGLALLLAGVVGFVLGVQVEKGRRTTSTVAAATPSPSTTRPSGGTGTRAGTRPRGVGGKVGGVTGSTFTVTLPDGTTTKVVVSANTRFQKTSEGSLQDLAPGTVVVVQGPRGQDGSITANMVSIVPPGTRVGGTGVRQGGRGTTTTTVASASG